MVKAVSSVHSFMFTPLYVSGFSESPEESPQNKAKEQNNEIEPQDLALNRLAGPQVTKWGHQAVIVFLTSVGISISAQIFSIKNSLFCCLSETEITNLEGKFSIKKQ